MDMKAKVMAVLNRAWEQEQAFAAGLSDDERRAAGTLQHWSARDVVAYQAAWDEHLAGNLARASLV